MVRAHAGLLALLEARDQGSLLSSSGLQERLRCSFQSCYQGSSRRHISWENILESALRSRSLNTISQCLQGLEMLSCWEQRPFSQRGTEGQNQGDRHSGRGENETEMGQQAWNDVLGIYLDWVVRKISRTQMSMMGAGQLCGNLGAAPSRQKEQNM